jgi:hypothetical protein
MIPGIGFFSGSRFGSLGRIARGDGERLVEHDFSNET